MPEPEEALLRQRELYDAYIRKVLDLELNRKPGAGIFGMKGGPADDPCHERFAESLRSFYDELAARKPESETVRRLMAYACTAPQKKEIPRTAFWMLIAVQGLLQPLVALLSAQDAQELVESYEKSYRRRERMPVQNKLIKALQTASGQ